MQHIRIVVIGLPQILRDVITDIVDGQPDMDVVGDLPEDAEPVMVEDLAGTFVAVMAGPNGELPEIGARLLERRARGLRVLGLSSDGRRGLVYELRPTEVPIGEISPERLVNVIRAAVPFEAGEAPGLDRSLPPRSSPPPNNGPTT